VPQGCTVALDRRARTVYKANVAARGWRSDDGVHEDGAAARALPSTPPPADADSTGALHALIDDLDEDDFPTAVAAFDLAAYARATATSDYLDGFGGPESGVRPSFPTLTEEVGALPNEPEEDTLLRCLGGGDRELRVRVSAASVTEYPLGPEQGYLLGLMDGVTSITDVLDISPMSRLDTLRAIEDLLRLGVVG
jgi:hypothetical protein